MSEVQSSRNSKEHAANSILLPALRVGLASGGFGFLIGGTSGILKDANPFLFGLVSFVQCGTLGASFWAARSCLLVAQNKRVDASPSDLTKTSAAAGGIAGGFSGLIFRGPRNVFPGVICISLFAATGQILLNYAAQRRFQAQKGSGVLESIMKSRWSPMRPINDREHADMLREQLLKVEVEIAVLDDKISALQSQKETDSEHNDDKNQS